MKTRWKIGVSILIGTAVLVLLIYGSGYLVSLQDTALPELPATAELEPPGAVALGSTVHARVRLELPLYRRVTAVELTPGTGAVALTPEATAGAWRWSHRTWTIEVPLRPLQPGTIPAGELRLTLSGRDDQTGQLTLPVPPLEVKALQLAPNTDLALAGELAADSTRRAGRLWLPVTVAVAALVGVILWLLLRRRRNPERILPPWERALAALNQLRSQLQHHELPLESAWVRLTDLVRNYLEARFQLPVTTRTTVEFLHELDEPDSPLPPPEKRVLRDFMTAADLVKFAKLPPDEAMILEATQQAEKLVLATRPEPTTATSGEGGAES